MRKVNTPIQILISKEAVDRIGRSITLWLSLVEIIMLSSQEVIWTMRSALAPVETVQIPPSHFWSQTARQMSKMLDKLVLIIRQWIRHRCKRVRIVSLDWAVQQLLEEQVLLLRHISQLNSNSTKTGHLLKGNASWPTSSLNNLVPVAIRVLRLSNRNTRHQTSKRV